MEHRTIKHIPNRIKIGVAILAIFFLNTCEAFEPKRQLMVRTDAIEHLSEGSYILSGTIIDTGEEPVRQHGFCWSESRIPTVNDDHIEMGARTITGTFKTSLTGLSPGTRYNIRAYATNDQETIYGKPIELTTYPKPQLSDSKTFGGSGKDRASAIIQCDDGGFAIAGSTESADGDIASFRGGGADFWVIKLDASRSLEWEKSLGGTNEERASSIAQTFDGGYILAGASTSNDIDVSGNHGGTGYDCWIVKLDPSGDIQWQKSLGGSENDQASSIIQTADSGYAFTGRSYSSDGDVSLNHGDEDCWVVKLDVHGNIEWEKTLGGSAYDGGVQIIQTADGGYMVAAETESGDGDVPYNRGGIDTWLIKLDRTGEMEWQKVFGTDCWDVPRSILQSPDGSYAMAGYYPATTNGFDFWILKLGQDGSPDWEKTLGGSENDAASSMVQAQDGGLVIAGETFSNDLQVSNNHGEHDFWVVKLTNEIKIQWQLALGGSAPDKGQCIIQTASGGYAIAGYTESSDGDVINNSGLGDVWVVFLE